jgi:outer membrane protein assembly factor BamB
VRDKVCDEASARLILQHPHLFMTTNQELLRQRLAPALIIWLVVVTAGSATAQGAWPMFGRDATRNSASPETNPPVWWDVQTGRNIKWQAAIGMHAWAQPVVADGLVWIGTDNQLPRDPAITGPAGVLMCFRESDGEFLYQHASPARQGPGYWQAHTGTAGSPLIEGDRLWFVSTRSEVICLDIGPLHRGEGLPTEIWKLDMLDELGVIPIHAIMGGGNLCSIGASHGDLIYVSTGNGTDYSGKVPAPWAPALVCLSKNTGEIVWEDNSPGANIIFAEWGNPLVIEAGGRAQVIAPQGDGWIRSFDALTGKLIWKFDINPKKAQRGPGLPGFFSTAPVFYRDRVYIAIGNYREFGPFDRGRLVCLDPSREGDISLELDEGPDRGQPNPNSGVVWHFDEIGRTMSTVAIRNGLVIAPDYSGRVHCLDADSGQVYWTHDLRSETMSSPLIVEDRIYIADEEGDMSILALSREKRVMAECSLNNWISSSPIHANGVLYVASRGNLHAIGAQTSTDWPEWRGPDRSNVSGETGLLQEWPEAGPPLLWTVSGLGTGIASVSVAGGQVFTTGYHEESEFAYALDAGSGEARWATRIGPTVRESSLMRWLSQRAPTVDGDRVYVSSAGGDLFCLASGTGEVLWRKNYPADFLSLRPIWGFCDHPLVDGEKLIAVPAGPAATVVALDKRTGAVIWQTHVPEVNREGYSAPVLSEAAGVRQYVVSFADSLLAVAADDGRLLWRHARPVRIAASYTPIIQGDWVFAPDGYNAGMRLLCIVRNGTSLRAQEEYHLPFNFNPFQDATARIGAHVYAFQTAGLPVCIEWRTGNLAWGPIQTAIEGRAALTVADNHLFIRGANGLMVLAEATPTAYIEKGSFLIPDREEASGVTTPVVAGGRLYLRDNDRLLCYDVAADALARPRPEPQLTAVSPELLDDEADRPIGAEPRVGRDRAPDAIYVPTPQDVVERMLELARVTEEDVVYDLGSGDGRIVITAAAIHGARAVGYEIDRRLVELSRERVTEQQLDSLVRIEHEDIFTLDLDKADVIAVYLPTPLLERLLAQFEKLPPGVRIVSHQFSIPEVRPHKTINLRSEETGDLHRLFLWTTPLRRAF